MSDEPKYGWMNIYAGAAETGSHIHSSRAAADAIAGSGRLSCQRYRWDDDHWAYDPKPEPPKVERVDCERWVVVHRDGSVNFSDDTVPFWTREEALEFVGDADYLRVCRVHVREIVEGEPTYTELQRQVEGYRIAMAAEQVKREEQPDDTPVGVTYAQLLTERDALRDAIRKSRDAKGHNRCWFDRELYNLLPEHTEADDRLPPRDEFLGECAKYWDSCAQGNEYTPPLITAFGLSPTVTGLVEKLNAVAAERDELCHAINMAWVGHDEPFTQAQALETIRRAAKQDADDAAAGGEPVDGEFEKYAELQAELAAERARYVSLENHVGELESRQCPVEAAMRDPRWPRQWKLGWCLSPDRAGTFGIFSASFSVGVGLTPQAACEAALATVKP